MTTVSSVEIETRYPETSWLVDGGHFIGKENVHINGMLRKSRLFSSPNLLDSFLLPMIESVREKSPSVIVGQEKSGGILAAKIGERLAVPYIRLSKTAKQVGEIAAWAEGVVVLVDDNFISGRNLQSAMEVITGSGVSPDAIITLFDSSDEGFMSSFTETPTEAVFNLGIKSWPVDDCELCEVFGPDSVGKSLSELTRR